MAAEAPLRRSIRPLIAAVREPRLSQLRHCESVTRSRLLYTWRVADRFDLDLLDEDPFEVDAQAAHLFKHPHLGLHDVYDVWTNDPLFYPAKPPAHWLMCAEVAGRVLVVPLAPARDGAPHRCRPIGCYEAAPGLADQYRRDR